MEDVEYGLRMIYEAIKDDSTFRNLEEFVAWSRTCKKKKTGFVPYKLNKTKPHSPENTYWYYRVKMIPEGIVPVFCADCKITCPTNGTGCKAYKEWFIKNWNKDISINPNKEQLTEKREYFRYEHPDLVKEGIVFEASR